MSTTTARSWTTKEALTGVVDQIPAAPRPDLFDHPCAGHVLVQDLVWSPGAAPTIPRAVVVDIDPARKVAVLPLALSDFKFPDDEFYKASLAQVLPAATEEGVGYVWRGVRWVVLIEAAEEP